MKNKLYILVLGTLLLSTITGCKKDTEKEPDTFIGNVSKPVWVAPADYDYSSSMTAVVKVDIAAQYPDKASDFVLKDGDLLAAFSGGTCLGVASPQTGVFYLYVADPASLSSKEGAVKVSLRYYSAHYKNLFVAKDAFVFKNDDHLGSVADPFIPKFVVEK